jgi:hypothetical protein
VSCTHQAVFATAAAAAAPAHSPTDIKTCPALDDTRRLAGKCLPGSSFAMNDPRLIHFPPEHKPSTVTTHTTWAPLVKVRPRWPKGMEAVDLGLQVRAGSPANLSSDDSKQRRRPEVQSHASTLKSSIMLCRPGGRRDGLWDPQKTPHGARIDRIDKLTKKKHSGSRVKGCR